MLEILYYIMEYYIFYSFLFVKLKK